MKVSQDISITWIVGVLVGSVAAGIKLFVDFNNQKSKLSTLESRVASLESVVKDELRRMEESLQSLKETVIRQAVLLEEIKHSIERGVNR